MRTDDLEIGPFKVEVDSGGCERCGYGKSWTVAWPDGSIEGISFENVEDAGNLASAMNRAFMAGQRNANGIALS